MAYDRAALADLAGEHVADGVRASKTRRGRGARARQVARGAPGAAGLLLAAARDGGAPSPASGDSMRGQLLIARSSIAWLRTAGDPCRAPRYCGPAGAASTGVSRLAAMKRA